MEAINLIFNPSKEFTDDNIRLIKRCHKLDHKGSFMGYFRFHKSGIPYNNRIRRDGIHRFHRETHIYALQQHHCWFCLGK
ncbi:hypothetical protein NC652_037923 [Populus alba x Populus x berolinensis]|nr:hypothetical protein NC652_037923 [Populus alba x Populus x berolinensis]